MKTYSEKLKDPRWQRRRLEIFARDNWTCACCGSGSKTLHVHHLRYRGEPWQAKDRELETLCEKCHNARERFNKLIALMPTSDAVRLGGILTGLEGVFATTPPDIRDGGFYNFAMSAIKVGLKAIGLSEKGSGLKDQ